MSDYWLKSAYSASLSDDECGCKKQGETRTWKRTIFVPERMKPIDIINAYSHKLPLPPFFALQPGVNKLDVECIASAMLNPKLQWHTLYHFTIAPFEHYSAGGLAPVQIGDDFNPLDHIGAPVLISGHHRFLAFLLSGSPPHEPLTLQVNKAPIATSIFPWSVVEWGR